MWKGFLQHDAPGQPPRKLVSSKFYIFYFIKLCVDSQDSGLLDTETPFQKVPVKILSYRRSPSSLAADPRGILRKVRRLPHISPKGLYFISLFHVIKNPFALFITPLIHHA
jgi:hypothetical protein